MMAFWPLTDGVFSSQIRNLYIHKVAERFAAFPIHKYGALHLCKLMEENCEHNDHITGH